MCTIARRSVLLGGSLAFLAAASVASACSIPVFRYALERWPPEPYAAIIFHKGQLAPEDQAVVEWLRKTATANPPCPNIETQTVDLAARQEEAILALWKAETEDRLKAGLQTAELPWVVLSYPQGAGNAEKVWSGRLRPETAKALIDSPARREVVKHLVGGASAVWLLLEGGNRAKDDAAALLLQTELKKLEQELKLPEPDEGSMPEEMRPKEGAALKISFPLVRMSRTSPSEAVLVQTLLGTEPDLKKADKPIAFPVFGRGRALPGLIGEGINADNITEACAFVVGPCSCQVKAMNPGWDLLMIADWESALGGEPPKAIELPPLTNPSAAASVEQVGAGPRARPPMGPRTLDLGQARGPAPTPASAATPAGTASALMRNILLAVVAGVVILGVIGILVARRSGASGS